MDWNQFLALAGTLVAVLYTFYQMTKKAIADFREQMKLINEHHRQDMKCMDEKFMKIDEKWERLFERLLVQDKQK